MKKLLCFTSKYLFESDEHGDPDLSFNESGGGRCSGWEIANLNSGVLDGIDGSTVVDGVEGLGIDGESQCDFNTVRDPDKIIGQKTVVNTEVGFISRVSARGDSVSEAVGVNGVTEELGDVADGNGTSHNLGVGMGGVISSSTSNQSNQRVLLK